MQVFARKFVRVMCKILHVVRLEEESMFTAEELNTLDKMSKNTEFTRLKSIRIRQGLTQQKFATMLGISLRSYQDIEKGKIFPRIDVAVRIARTFGKSVEYIWNGRGIIKTRDIPTYFHDDD